MKTPHVLVVDDDRDTRELYKLVYETSGYRVSEADGVSRGVDAAQRLRPDVVLTDWRLADGDGMELCRALRRHGPTRLIPTVAATGMTLNAASRAEARRWGCETFLTKPIDIDVLLRATASTLQLTQARVLRAASVRLRRFAVSLRSNAAGTSAARTLTASGLLSASQASVNGGVALIIADDTGRYVGANDRAAELTGYDSKVLTTMSVADLTPEPQASAGQRLWNSFIADGTQEGVYLVKRRDGVAVPMRYVAIANITPGLHLSALTPADAVDIR
ncbi:MAG: response regulator [Acidobacteriota bacterium]|nr:response regulator [Acidobacteriota bacterium]